MTKRKLKILMDLSKKFKISMVSKIASLKDLKREIDYRKKIVTDAQKEISKAKKDLIQLNRFKKSVTNDPR